MLISLEASQRSGLAIKDIHPVIATIKQRASARVHNGISSIFSIGAGTEQPPK
jgi:hypothetical protein